MLNGFKGIDPKRDQKEEARPFEDRAFLKRKKQRDEKIRKRNVEVGVVQPFEFHDTHLF